ncbi:methyltransferase [Mycobacterium spongiae]|uniref:Methyltransferase domain-containing protein n=1 Tax=Mycobacterium spongiae TaxID=886343 RepID=A0A975PXI5_9MYCO|nr:methyltransferase [Mycobacterium spongiae]QUR67859.1 methyltransferase domain-containing protein [Mycobacterium spongiae]
MDRDPVYESITFDLWRSKCLVAAAELSIADHLASGPLSLDELAARCDCPAQRVMRLLRPLIGEGFFSRNQAGEYCNSEKTERLRSDHPQTLLPIALQFAWTRDQGWWKVADSVRTGRTGYQLEFGQELFEHLADNEKLAANFDRAMTALYSAETDGIVHGFNFGDVERLMDVGGGNGSTLVPILQQYDHLQGVLFDQDHVVERAKEALAESPVFDRIEFQTGDFFAPIEHRADTIMLRHVIHDWDWDDSQTILRHCRDSVGPDGQVLVVEMVVPEDDRPHPAKWLDAVMMIVTGGWERTEEQYRELFDGAGLRLDRVISATVPHARVSETIEILVGKPTTA